MHSFLSPCNKAALSLLVAFALPVVAPFLAANSEAGKSDRISNKPDSGGTLQPLMSAPGKLSDGRFYVPAVPKTINWGYIPNRNSKPILTVPSGSVVTFDTLSGEGMMEDQGRDPIKFFAKYGIKQSEVLKDAAEIATSDIKHDFVKDGPHIIIGPIAIEGAQPGDVLKVDMISFLPRVPYGLICSEQGKGVLAGEFPENAGTQPGASTENPELYNDVFTFVPIKTIGGKPCGIVNTRSGKQISFPINPFIGTMGIAPDTTDQIISVPPGSYGGNMDLKELAAGSTLYLPVQVPQAMYFIGDPHFAQGDGEVALTAVEGSLRATVKLSILKAGDPSIPGEGAFTQPFAETPDFWIPIGLDPNLEEAMKKAVRSAIKFLVDKMDMDRATALAYLSAATDFEVTQAVDIVKGIHGRISKHDFAYRSK